MTQLESARSGIITKEMKQVALDEKVTEGFVRRGVAEGTIVIPCNKNHMSIHPYGIGSGLRTKMNVNLGVSKDCYDYSLEKEKQNFLGNLKQKQLWIYLAMAKQQILGIGL